MIDNIPKPKIDYMISEEDNEWMNAGLGRPVTHKGQPVTHKGRPVIHKGVELPGKEKKVYFYSVAETYIVAIAAFGIGCCITSIAWIFGLIQYV